MFVFVVVGVSTFVSVVGSRCGLVRVGVCFVVWWGVACFVVGLWCFVVYFGCNAGVVGVFGVVVGPFFSVVVWPVGVVGVFFVVGWVALVVLSV